MAARFPIRWTAASNNEGMLRIANVTICAVVLGMVSAVTFTAPWPGAADVAVQVAALGVAAIVMLLRALAGWSRWTRPRGAFLLPYGLGAVALTCGVASVTPSGASIVYLGCVAAVWAASDTVLAAASIVVALGVLGIVFAGWAAAASAWEIAGFSVLMLGCFILGLNRRAHRVEADQSAALLAQAEQLREQQARVVALQERTRIAREIHDVLAHSLGALGLHIQATRAVLTDQHDETRVADLLDHAHRMATDGLSETRRAVHALRGETQPLTEGLAQLSANHQRRYGSPVTFDVTGTPLPLSPDAGLAVTRAAQESLVNAAKHAPRQPVRIRLDYTDTCTSLVVSNHLDRDGHGPPKAALVTVNGGLGLAGMRERLLLLDGTLSAGQHGDDWVVVAKVPR
jgi:signal transduction histidine kinase